MQSEQIILDFIKSYRSDKNLSQQKMAELFGSTLRTYQRIESGQTSVGLGLFLNFIRKYNEGLYFTFLSLFSRKTKSELGEGKLSNEFHVDGRAVQGVYDNSLIVPQERSSVDSLDEDFLVGYWEYNTKEDLMFMSQEFKKIYSIPEDCDKPVKRIEDNIYAEDKPIIERSMNWLITEDISYHNQHRVKMDDIYYYIVNAWGQKSIVDGKTILNGFSRAKKMKIK